MSSNNTSIFVALVGGLLLIWLGQRISSRTRFKGLPRVGIDPGFFGLRTRAAKDQFFNKGQQLLEEGYAKVRSRHLLLISFMGEKRIDGQLYSILTSDNHKQYKDTPYVIQTCDNERLVIPDKFIGELKNLPDTRLSFKEELLDRFLGKYTKLDAVRGTNIHRDIVRFQLTKSLGVQEPPTTDAKS